MAGEQRWQIPGAARDMDPVDRFVCPICLELFDKPIRVSCGHIFCSPCLQQCMKQKNPVCGVCRFVLTPEKRAADVERQMEATEASCKGCNKKMNLSNMRVHSASCSKYESYVMDGIKSVTKDQPQHTRDVPNRFTFICPYCREQNLDQEGLVDHCRKFHFADPTPVVCPVCASMPWGDPNYRSSNFMEHINRRHRFSYDTFVDYSVDEDAMMNEALVRSMMDK
ncbi:E3 ubiquitin-protein ligase RNF114 [Rhinophrynus dorsalis]